MSESAVETIFSPLQQSEKMPTGRYASIPAGKLRNSARNKFELAELAQTLSRGEWTPTYNIVVKSALGSRIQDVEGRWYLDFLSSASSVALGYGNLLEKSKSRNA
jgi:4-aminobutyrate aminotransferase-like enzyme